jgi:exodeoxyribonuclease V
LWNDQQAEALKAVSRWFQEYKTSRNPTKRFFYLAGYAGTGKTTLARHFAEGMNSPLFAAFTGKAAMVMRKAGCSNARTIHSLIYIADQDEETGEIKFYLNKESVLADADLLVIDECSMVNEQIGNDLLSFSVPILVLGDPAQLPPVEGSGFFTRGKPDMMLTEIHRQAKDNPIIYLASLARSGQMPDIGTYDNTRVLSKISSADALAADQVLVGRNITRQDMNRKMRKLLGYADDLPMPAERLICLKNDKSLNIFNGGTFTVLKRTKIKTKPDFKRYTVTSDDEHRKPIILKTHDSFFDDSVDKPEWKALAGSQEMAFAYAITVHKSQGSQWENVLLYGSEAFVFREDKFRFLYTGITRAAEKLTLII